jgi:hypothetical protein
MNPAAGAAALAALLFLGTVACLEVGYRLGGRQFDTPELAHEGTGAIEAAVFALLGLLLGLSFAAATSRLESRRQLIVEEANAIGTAYLRLDLLAAGDQPEMRRSFREYLDARLRVYQKLPDLHAAEQELARSAKIQQRIWSQAVAATRSDPTQNSARLLLPALNEMIDITTARTVALYTQLPWLIIALLGSVTLLSGVLAGFAMAKRRRRSWLHMMAYALVVSITIYTVIDLDHPRSGLIRLDAADNALSQLRNSIQ